MYIYLYMWNIPTYIWDYRAYVRILNRLGCPCDLQGFDARTPIEAGLRPPGPLPETTALGRGDLGVPEHFEETMIGMNQNYGKYPLVI